MLKKFILYVLKIHSAVLSRHPPIFLSEYNDRSAPPISPLFHIDALEREWLNRPYDPSRLSEYESRLGSDALNRIIIADRGIGKGYITGGVMPECPLAEATREQKIRLRYLVGLLEFFFQNFEKRKPDYAFTVGIAGAVALTLACVCKYLQVPLLRLTHTRIGSRYLVEDSPDGMAEPVKQLFWKALTNPSLVNDTLDEAKKVISHFRLNPERPEYTIHGWKLMGDWLRPIDYAALLWRTVTRRPPELLVFPFPFSYLTWELKKHYKAWRLSYSADFQQSKVLNGTSYAYFPLHIDPEASTMVYAPLYTNQLAVIEALAKSLPVSWSLVVKEHVPMLGKRPPHFYRQLKAIPKVILISPFENGFDLIKRADLTCVITGTAGWESIILQRPTLCLGPALYQTIGQGFVYCSEITRLSESIRQAISIEPADNERLVLYVASVLKVSFELSEGILWSDTPATIKNNPHAPKEIANRITQIINALPS